MLAHQGLRPAALAVFERLDDGVMLSMCLEEHFVHPLQIGAIEGESLWAGERHPAVALQRLGKNDASRLVLNQAVKARVHLRVRRFIVFLEPAFAEQLITGMQAGTQLTDESLRGTLLRDSARSHPFEDAADVNRIENVTRRERAYHIAARAVFDEKTFLCEQWESLAHGCS